MKTRSQAKNLREPSTSHRQKQNVPLKKRAVDGRQRKSKEPNMNQKRNPFDAKVSPIKAHATVLQKADDLTTWEERQQQDERQLDAHFKRQENFEHSSPPFHDRSLSQVPGSNSFVDAAGLLPSVAGVPRALASFHNPETALNAVMSPYVETSKPSPNHPSPPRVDSSDQAPHSPYIPTKQMTRLSLEDMQQARMISPGVPADFSSLSVDMMPLLSDAFNSGAQAIIQHASPRGLHQVGASLDAPREIVGARSSVPRSAIENPVATHVPGPETHYQGTSSCAQSTVVGHGNIMEEQLQGKNMEKGKRFRRWTKEEDEKLKVAVDQVGGPPIDWATVAELIEGERTARQCKTRWKNALSPHINHQPFTKQEDDAIISYRKSGLAWPEIADLMNRRACDQIRDRFMNHINPELKTTPWTKEEDEQLTEAQKLLGNKWTDISKVLVGRSEKSIKNRWYNRKTMQSRKARREAIKKARKDKYRFLVLPSADPSVSCSGKKPTTSSAKEEGTDPRDDPDPMKEVAQQSDVVSSDDGHPHVIKSAKV